MSQILTILALAILPLCCWAGEQGYAVYDEATATLTFKYGEKPSGDNVYDTDDTSEDGPGWDRSVLKTVIFDPSYAKARPLSTRDWFCDALLLENIIGIQYLNTSEVWGMARMFHACESLTNLDLSHFDTKKVEYMDGMFSCCSNLTNLNISSFNTSSVRDMEGMFSSCISLTDLDLRHFDTGNVIFSFNFMFAGCSSLQTLKLGKFGSKHATLMVGLFSDCINLEELSFDAFETNSVTDMQRMFENCQKLVSLDLRSFDTSNVENMRHMFDNCRSLTSLDISTFNPVKVTNMSGMFFWCASLKDLHMFHKKAISVIDHGSQFMLCLSLTSLDLSSFASKNCKNVIQMFYHCENLETIDLSNFDTSNVTSMFNMFCDCWSLKSLDLSSFNTQKCESMMQMFSSCENLKSIDLSNFDTRNVISMAGMFSGCSSLKILDLRSFDTRNVIEGYGMFGSCYDLERIYVGDNWDMSNAIYDLYTHSINTEMFCANSNLIGGAGSLYSDDFDTNTYARIDGGPDNPGYMTAAFQEEGVTYTSKDDGVSVVHASVEESFVDIPSSVNDGNEDLVVNTIGEGAFENKTDLKLVSFPETISEIGASAFAGCSNLSAIYSFAAEPIVLGDANAHVRTRADGEEKSASTVFAAVDKESCVLYVPKNSRDKYRNAEGWAEFQNIEEMESDILGDANNDGEVDNKDLNAIADYILTEQAKNFIFMNADMNKDKTLNAVDIVHLVDKIKPAQ